MTTRTPAWFVSADRTPWNSIRKDAHNAIGPLGRPAAESPLFSGVQTPSQDPPEPYAWVHYDPANGDIPLPNDAVRDADRGQLALPTDDPNLTEADLELRAYLNALDGWSTASTITVRFSEPMDAEPVTQHTVQVWEWGMDPVNVEGLEWEFDSTATELSIHAPLDGWKRSGQYAVAIVGGDGGLSTLTDLPLGPDAAFSYLILDEPLDAFEHQRAFPGATRAERLDSATALEAIRLDLQPVFSFLEDDVEPDQRVPRDELAALFRFTVTSPIELAMDRPSQRMPLPFNLLIDPTTGFVDLPPSDRDSDLEADAKQQANRLEGFSVSANLMFDLTGPADPSTVNSETVQLIDLSVTPEVVPITVTLMGEAGAAACQETPVPQDCKHLVVALEDSALPLKSASTYALVVSNELRGSEGETIVPMSIGHFMTSTAPLGEVRVDLPPLWLLGIGCWQSTRVSGYRHRPPSRKHPAITSLLFF